VIVDKTLYGCTFSFLRHGLARFGVTVTHVDLTDVANLEAALSDKTRVVYFETPANPNMRVVDIAAIAAAAHRRGALVMVDNTYCTPLLQRPLELGADLVVHSATKYLGGHGDLTAGAVVGGAELLGRIRMVGLKDMTGAVLSASDANLILRGLKTLELRMERHCSSARLAADLIAAHPAVKAVHFPGLPSHPQHAVAKRQMSDFGGMIAFELTDGYAGGLRFMDALRLVTRAVSLGDAETLVQHPASMTHSTYTPEERALYGISDGLVRLSIGLETPADLLSDLSQALDHAGAAMSLAAE
jgi:methionine-gamma-lyase